MIKYDWSYRIDFKVNFQYSDIRTTNFTSNTETTCLIYQNKVTLYIYNEKYLNNLADQETKGNIKDRTIFAKVRYLKNTANTFTKLYPL